MFDGIGFVQALRDKGFIFSNARCLIIGCGAAGQAIGAELLRNNVAHCQIVDPNMQALESFDAMAQEDSARIFTSQRLPDHISRGIASRTLRQRHSLSLPSKLDARQLMELRWQKAS